MLRWPCLFCCGGWMGLATRLAGDGIGDFSYLAVMPYLDALPSRLEQRCISSGLRRNGTLGLLCCSLPWGFSFLRLGRRSFFFVGCCKICFRGHVRAIWRGGGRRRCCLGFRTLR